jgi:small nuclear ribonucleoprotein (snRNP)-like protein
MEGVIIGFDEYMNLVLDDGIEINTKTNARRPVGKKSRINYRVIKTNFGPSDLFIPNICEFVTGRLLLKGDNITLIQSANP